MLIKITYNSEELQPFQISANDILYAYIENQMKENNDGTFYIATDGSLMLKFETPNAKIISLETRTALYSIYRELIQKFDYIKDISLYEKDEVIEAKILENEEIVETTVEKEILTFSTEQMGLKVESVSLNDRALSDKTQDTNDYQGITVQIPLSWIKEEEN